MPGLYDDIIHLPHHISPTRPPMSLQNRAAQFAPFAALSGYDAAIRETGRLTDRQTELEEDDRMELDRKQAFLLSILDDRPTISVTHFVPDTRKVGGAYITTTGQLKRIDTHKKALVFSNGIKISVDSISAIESDLFPDFL